MNKNYFRALCEFHWIKGLHLLLFCALEMDTMIVTFPQAAFHLSCKQQLDILFWLQNPAAI